jgi:hypothetical protein
MAMVATKYRETDREEEAKARRPRTKVLVAKAKQQTSSAKAFYSQLKARYPNIIKYLAEH